MPVGDARTCICELPRVEQVTTVTRRVFELRNHVFGVNPGSWAKRYTLAFRWHSGGATPALQTLGHRSDTGRTGTNAAYAAVRASQSPQASAQQSLYLHADTGSAIDTAAENHTIPSRCASRRPQTPSWLSVLRRTRGSTGHNRSVPVGDGTELSPSGHGQRRCKSVRVVGAHTRDPVRLFGDICVPISEHWGNLPTADHQSLRRRRTAP